MNVLVACEFSGVVRDAFLARGHNAWSCDLLPTEVDGPHFQDDIFEVLKTSWMTWDLMIAHPPCTYLCRSGARWWPERKTEQKQALQFVEALLAAPIPRIALENPPGRIGTAIRPADQYVQPWQFGDGEIKMTGFWLKNLPPLRPTRVVKGRKPRAHWAAPGPDRWKERSRTYQGMAAAMAEQWGQTQ